MTDNYEELVTRRFRNLPPPSFKDDRDSIQTFRRMYGK